MVSLLEKHSEETIMNQALIENLKCARKEHGKRCQEKCAEIDEAAEKVGGIGVEDSTEELILSISGIMKVVELKGLDE